MSVERQYGRWLMRKWLVGPLALALTIGVGARWIYGNQDPGTDPPAPITLADNAFDTFRQAGAVISKADKDAIGRVSNGKSQPTDPDAKTLLDRYRSSLNTVRGMLGHPCRLPALRSANDLVPYLADFRALGQLFRVEGQACRKAGDLPGAARSYGDALRLSAQVSHGSSLIGYLVSTAIAEIARYDLWDLLDEAKARKDTATMATVIAGLEEWEKDCAPLAEAFTEEKYGMQAYALEIFRHPERLRHATGAEDVDSWPPTVLPIVYLAWPKREIYANISGYMDALIRRTGAPYQADRMPIPEPQDIFSRLLVPVFEQCALKDAVARTHNALLLASFALERYKAECGDYPETLGALVTGGYLTHLPTDPFNDDKMLVYRRTPETLRQLPGTEDTAGGPIFETGTPAEYALYSVGPDRNDDGGKPIDNPPTPDTPNKTPQERRRPLATSKGDIVPRVNVAVRLMKAK